MLLKEVGESAKVVLELLIIQIASHMQLPKVANISQHLHKLHVLHQLFVQFIGLLSIVEELLIMLAIHLFLTRIFVVLIRIPLRHDYLKMQPEGKWGGGEGKWGGSGGGQLRQLRELDLEQIEKPKTLVILHYCGKRISVPLFQQVANLAQLLYHHISKLEQAVLSNEQAWEKNSNAQILCFQIKKDSAAMASPERQSDGDLRSDILLSLLRVEGRAQESPEELTFRVDVTKVYKYLEIQPFFRFFQGPSLHSQVKLQAEFPYFSFHRLLGQTRVSSTFLARRTSNGHFYAVKVYSTGAGVGLEELRTVEQLQRIDQARRDAELRCSLLVRSHLCALVPHPEAEEGDSDDESSCKHIALASPFFVKGTLEELLKDARYSRSKRIAQMDCLNYLKELMWGAHLLHEKYNLIHRAIVPANLHIDQNGQLRLTAYFSCLPCYNQDGHATYLAKPARHSAPELQEGFEEGEYDAGEYTAPEVLRGQPYNYLVDFYAIGVIIRKLYELSQAHERVPVSQNNQNLMMTMINRLTSTDLNDRQAIVSEIIEDIERENEAPEPPLPPSSLLLQDIKVGRPIEPRASRKYIQNEESGNGIDLEVVSNYFRKPKTKEALLRPSVKKTTLKKGKEKSSVKNSRERSEGKGQKCFSKASAESNPRKVSKKKIGSLSKESHPSQSRDSKATNIRKQESPVKRSSKSKSHQRKKKEEGQPSKLYTHSHEQEARKGVPILPRSPKSQVVPRNKSPLLREKHK